MAESWPEYLKRIARQSQAAVDAHRKKNIDPFVDASREYAAQLGQDTRDNFERISGHNTEDAQRLQQSAQGLQELADESAPVMRQAIMDHGGQFVKDNPWMAPLIGAGVAAAPIMMAAPSVAATGGVLDSTLGGSALNIGKQIMTRTGVGKLPYLGKTIASAGEGVINLGAIMGAGELGFDGFRYILKPSKEVAVTAGRKSVETPEDKYKKDYNEIAQTMGTNASYREQILDLSDKYDVSKFSPEHKDLIEKRNKFLESELQQRAYPVSYPRAPRQIDVVPPNQETRRVGPYTYGQERV